MENISFPNRITIELTNKCNAECTFCHRQEVNMQIGEMDEKLYYKIIDEAAEHLPVAIVLFFRGESLLCSKLIDYIIYAKNKGIGPIQLASNGMALTKELALGLCESGLDFISFSLDTMDPQVYAQSRRAGDLKIAIENVKYMGELCKTRRKNGEKTPTLQVSTIDMDVYRSTQNEFIEFWKQYVDIVRVYLEHDNNGRIVDEQLRNKIVGSVNRKPCKKLYNDMIIYWDGRISLCNYDWDEKHNLGNVNSHSIDEIWHSDAFNNLRSMHENGNIDDDYICKECQHWAMAYTKEGFFGKIIKADED